MMSVMNEAELREKIEGVLIKLIEEVNPNAYKVKSREEAKTALLDLYRENERAVIDAISLHMGWEESRDFYAVAFGHEPKFVSLSNTMFNSPEFEGFKKQLSNTHKTGGKDE